MGFGFKIGERRPVRGDEIDRETATTVGAEDVDEHPEGWDYVPHASSTRHRYTSEIMPSYAGWRKFMDETRYDEVIGERVPPLVEQHPGVRELGPEDVDAVEDLLSMHREDHDVGEEDRPDWGVDELGGPNSHAVHRVRLRWLAYWTAWAVENCDDPVFANR